MRAHGATPHLSVIVAVRCTYALLLSERCSKPVSHATLRFLRGPRILRAFCHSARAIVANPCIFHFALLAISSRLCACKMPQALDASSYVFQGVWIDWSKGAISGSTLTLSSVNAAALVAVLALFVQMTGSQLWTVIQFIFHQCRASRAPVDGYYHQQQAILRNNTSGLSTLRQLLRITWAWRGRTRRPFRRSAHLMLWAVFHFVLFGLAGVFSSNFVTAGKVALSRSPYCGVLSPSYLESLGTVGSSIVNRRNLDLQAKSQDDTQLSQEYVQTCYDATNPSSSCSSYPKRRLSWTTKRNVACPFDSAVCHPSVSAVSFDTGYIDSSDDLGLNAQDRDRISYRRLTTCIPLNDQVYITSARNVSESGGPTVEAVDAYYGPSRGADRNATYSFTLFTRYLSADQIDDFNPYQLHQVSAYSGNGWENVGSFLPIPEIARPNADVTLAFLSFDKTYETPINDIWFAAHHEAHLLQPSTGVDDTVYTRDLPVTTLGCTEQHQICTGGASSNSAARTCTPLMGMYQIQTDTGGVTSLNFTDRQNSTFVRVFQSAEDSTLSTILSRLIQRDMPLLARKQVILVVSSNLPDTQWEKEAEYFFSIGMAHLQRNVVNYGTGQMSPDTSFIAVANTTADKWLCQNLVVRGTSFQSFSILALTLVFTIGLLIVAFSLVVDDIFAFVQRRWNRGAIGREMWKANDALQIQRMLYEHQGCGTWHDEPNGVPVTNFGDKMGMLEVGDIAMHNGRPASQLSIETGHDPEWRPKAQSQSWLPRFSPHLKGVKHHPGTGLSPLDTRDGLQDLTWKNEIQ
jgi:hypothetical protein